MSPSGEGTLFVSTTTFGRNLRTRSDTVQGSYRNKRNYMFHNRQLVSYGTMENQNSDCGTSFGRCESRLDPLRPEVSIIERL